MNHDSLKLENQLCFPLYACSREIIKQYQPYLQRIGLTYTQYIAMMVLWEHTNCTSKTLGTLLHLDSGTLTPLLKRLEKDGFILRQRLPEDERHLMIALTDKGRALQDEAVCIPTQMQAHSPLTADEAQQLYTLLQKLLHA